MASKSIIDLAAAPICQFLLFVYNATLAAENAKPDLVVQVQIMRDNQAVIATPLKKIEPPTTADVARLP